MAPGSHLRLSPGTAGRRWVCPVRGYALSITAICSSCQIEIATIRFVNAAAEYLEKPFRRELRIQPVGSAIGITADVLVDGVAAQHAVQVQLVGKLLFSCAILVSDRLSQTDDQQRVQRLERDLHIVAAVIQRQRSFVLRLHIHVGQDHPAGFLRQAAPGNHRLSHHSSHCPPYNRVIV